MSRLIDEINKYKEAFKQKAPKEIQEMMLEATKKLENSSLSKNALTVGSTAKEINNLINQKVEVKDTTKPELTVPENIEILQGTLTFLHRSFDFVDLMANLSGITIAYILVTYYLQYKKTQ